MVHRSTNILNHINVLVDGKFEIDKKDISLPYCGSSNQRVIDVKESLRSNKLILYKEE
jgi:anaerobic ribonucleoside-triphosphate reductase activating protein